MATLGELIGPMLVAGRERFIFATGHGSDHAGTGTEVYAKYGDLRVLEQTYGETWVDDGTTLTIYQGTRVIEVGPSHRTHLGRLDRLITPSLLYIWGRPGEDWRMTEDVTPAGPGLFAITLAPTVGNDHGHILVTDTGQVATAEWPGFRWSIDQAVDDPSQLPPPPTRPQVCAAVDVVRVALQSEMKRSRR